MNDHLSGKSAWAKGFIAGIQSFTIVGQAREIKVQKGELEDQRRSYYLVNLKSQSKMDGGRGKLTEVSLVNYLLPLGYHLSGPIAKGI